MLGLFFTAAMYGGTDGITFIRTYDGDINAITDSGSSALILAAKNNNAEVVDCLLSRPIRINIQDEEGDTALHWAASNGYLFIAQKLVNKGASCVLKNNKGRTAEQEALLGNGSEIVRFLQIQRNATPQEREQTESWLAAITGDKKKLNLIKKYYKMGATAIEGRNALMFAAAKGNLEIVKDLATSFPDQLNTQDKDGNTALHWAVYHGKSLVVKALISAGASVTVQNKEGCTPENAALLNYEPGILQILQEARGASDEEFEKAQFLLAAINGDDVNLGIIKQYLKKHHLNFPNLNVDVNGYTALMLAACCDNFPAVKELIKTSGIALDAQGKHDETALSLTRAAGEERASIVNALLKSGANRDLANKTRLTLKKQQDIVYMFNKTKLKAREAAVNIPEEKSPAMHQSAIASFFSQTIEKLKPKNEYRSIKPQ